MTCLKMDCNLPVLACVNCPYAYNHCKHVGFIRLSCPFPFYLFYVPKITPIKNK